MTRKGVGACSGFAGPPTDLPGGDHAGPPVLSRCAPSPGRPPLGTLSPTAYGSGSPFGSPMGEGFFKRALAQAPQGQSGAGEDGDLLANRHRNPQPPRGRNACYGVLREGLRGRKRFVPGTPKAWQAGTPFLILPRAWPLGSVLRARKSLFWRLGVKNITHNPCVRCRANLGSCWRCLRRSVRPTAMILRCAAA